jgi:hypothetical protein
MVSILNYLGYSKVSKLIPPKISSILWRYALFPNEKIPNAKIPKNHIMRLALISSDFIVYYSQSPFRNASSKESCLHKM